MNIFVTCCLKNIYKKYDVHNLVQRGSTLYLISQNTHKVRKDNDLPAAPLLTTVGLVADIRTWMHT